MEGKFGKDHIGWKGDKAGYRAKHMWIQNHYGKASRCENNSLHKVHRFHWANISGEYKRNIEDWKQLCPSCHAAFDNRGGFLRGINWKDTCKHGHKLTIDNLFLKRFKHYRSIECRACRREHVRKFRLKERFV